MGRKTRQRSYTGIRSIVVNCNPEVTKLEVKRTEYKICWKAVRYAFNTIYTKVRPTRPFKQFITSTPVPSVHVRSMQLIRPRPSRLYRPLRPFIPSRPTRDGQNCSHYLSILTFEGATEAVTPRLYEDARQELGSRLNDSERDRHTQSPEQNDFASLPRQQVFE